MSEAAADWDMSAFFSGHGRPDYREFRDRLEADIGSMHEELARAPALDAASLEQWRDTLLNLESISTRLHHLVAYLDCLGSADATDEAVQRDGAALATTSSRCEQLFVRVEAALGDASQEDFEALQKSEEAASYFLGRLRRKAKTSMAVEQEALASELSVDGLSAWGRLYDQISGNLMFDLELPGQKARHIPVAMTRTLLEDGDPQVRRAAFAGSAKAWESVATPVAACLNAIAGSRHTLYSHRGIEDFLQPALFDAGLEAKTLEQMFEVVRDKQSVARDFLLHKAGLLGMERLHFCDLMAPLPGVESERLSWQAGCDKVQDAFDAAYPALGELARRAFAERWIDHSARDGKRPGGFCTTSPVAKQSRIFMTFNGAMGDVQTLAHELGHAFHSHVLRDERLWASDYPMPLAETASTFAENLVTNRALEQRDTPDDVKRSLLDQRLQGAAAFLLNTPMRFDFEHAFYDQRKAGELSVSEIKNLMLDAQRKNYGEALEPESLDPWFWASKLHFYITEISFYNFPYTFGYLFSLGIFARFLDQGESFLPTYEELLRRTGSAPAEVIAKETLGVDLQKPDFWRASIQLIEQDWRRFQELS
jgi:oligoendopeptidase F